MCVACGGDESVMWACERAREVSTCTHMLLDMKTPSFMFELSETFMIGLLKFHEQIMYQHAKIPFMYQLICVLNGYFEHIELSTW